MIFYFFVFPRKTGCESNEDQIQNKELRLCQDSVCFSTNLIPSKLNVLSENLGWEGMSGQ